MGSITPPPAVRSHLAPIPPTCTLQEVRTGKTRHIAGTTISSAIQKNRRSGRVFATHTGLVDDEQVYEKHGGIDKALHGYNPLHYATWAKQRPEKAHLYRNGAFGENFVVAGLDEENLCIGDLFSVGSDGVVIEVSEPRQPCYKLNHRFEWEQMSIETQNTGRCGWYWRVKSTGYVQEGDLIQLIRRPNVEWSVGRIQELLYSKEVKFEEWEVASRLSGMGEEIAEIFELRITKGIEDMSFRLEGRPGKKFPVTWRTYRLVEKSDVSRRVKKFVFSIADSDFPVPNPEFDLFPHVRLKFGPNDTYIRAYSVVSGNMNTFELGIGLDDKSRGGSQYLHQQLQVGDSIDVASGHSILAPPNTRNAERDSHHVFIIGGIGITAFLPLFKHLDSMSASYTIHYAARTMSDAVYLTELPKDNTHVYVSDLHHRLDISSIIPPYTKNSADERKITKIYCCGPSKMNAAVRSLTRSLGYPVSQLHFEDFGSSEDLHNGPPFSVRTSRANKTFTIPTGKSILEILNAAGFEIPRSCEIGNCGNCSVEYSQGDVDHRGIALEPRQKETCLLSCVSRGKGEVVLEL